MVSITTVGLMLANKVRVIFFLGVPMEKNGVAMEKKINDKNSESSWKHADTKNFNSKLKLGVSCQLQYASLDDGDA